MVKEINGMGMEVCTTLGMLTAEQAKQLKEAGMFTAWFIKSSFLILCSRFNCIQSQSRYQP